MKNLTKEQQDKIELIESTFQKVNDVIDINLENSVEVCDAKYKLDNIKDQIINFILNN